MQIIDNTYIKLTRLESLVFVFLSDESVNNDDYIEAKKLNKTFWFNVSELTNEKIAIAIGCEMSSVESVVKSFYDVKIFNLFYENRRKQQRGLVQNTTIHKIKKNIVCLNISKKLNVEKFKNPKMKYQKHNKHKTKI